MSTNHKVYRIVSAAPAEAEAQVNALADDYVPLAWSFSDTTGEVIISCVLMSARELQRQAFNAQRAAGPMLIPRA